MRARLISLTGVLTLAGAFAAAPSALAADRLPDLGMARIGDLRVDKAGGQRRLRYTTIVVNVGTGPFVATGTRSSTDDQEMAVTQRISDDGGGFREMATSARLFFAGDGHTHWHVRDLEDSELVRLDNGSKAGTGAKRGFCFFDNVRYRLGLAGAPQAPVHTGCADASALSVTMGLSIGWGDAYYATLPDQYIDISGLSAGRYRLNVTADKRNDFVEANDSNNTTWVDLQLKGNGSIRVIGYGPAA